MKGHAALDYSIRGGEHSNIKIEILEKAITKTALQSFFSNPNFARKGIRWTYNLMHFYSIYGSCDPYVKNVLFNEKPYPDYIEVETTTFCNFRCKMCENPHMKEKRQHMKLKEFKYILDQFPNLKWIGMAGIGQSFLNPDYPKMLKLCKERNIYIETFDRFMFIDRKMSEFLVKIGMDKIYCSLDAATKETYKKMNLGLDFDRVVKHLKILDEVKKKNNSHYPELFFHFIITKDNINEVENYIDFIHSLDIEVEFIQFTRMLHDFPEIHDEFVEVSDELKERIIRKAENLGLKATFNINTSENKGSLDTCTVWYQPFIFVDGTVVPCCSLNEQNDRAWQRETSLGNIFKTDFRKIWYGEKYANMITKLKDNKMPINCMRCVLKKW